jgi:NADH:ubiquinone oxidoreductase subunit 5 (subunit L)/multisubunit Na+/H+ antiporter MnhA subunit
MWIPLLPAAAALTALSEGQRTRPAAAIAAGGAAALLAAVTAYQRGTTPPGVMQGTGAIPADSVSAVFLLISATAAFLIMIASRRSPHLSRLCLHSAAVLWFFTADNFASMAAASMSITAATWLLFHQAGEDPEKTLILQLMGDLALAAAAILAVTSGAIPVALVAAAALIRASQVPVLLWPVSLAKGPVPGLALVHSGAMLGAGVYLAVRIAPYGGPLFLPAGVITALTAAVFAAMQTDPRRIVSGAVLSHYGLMFVAVGAGAPWMAVFHFATTAFAAVVLTFGAGLLVDARNGDDDIRRMGGLQDRLGAIFPISAAAVLCLAGLPGPGPFFSLLPIIDHLRSAAPGALLPVAAALGIVSFALFRFLLIGFTGVPRHPDEPHPPPEGMAVPLAAIAALGASIGWFRSQFEQALKREEAVDVIPIAGAFSGEWPAAACILLAAAGGFILALRRRYDPTFPRIPVRWREAERFPARAGAPHWAAAAAVALGGLLYYGISLSTRTPLTR